MTNQVRIIIWGREFSLPVEYDCYTGELITVEQIEALDNFISHPEWISEVQPCVEAYCQEQVLADDSNGKKDNIFSYIKPISLFINRDPKHPKVALICEYRYDLEHGLVIVFDHNGHTTIGEQGIL